MSAKFSRFSVFLGSILAALMMTSISCFTGYAAHLMLPLKITKIITIFLFLYFGFKLISEAIWYKKDD